MIEIKGQADNSEDMSCGTDEEVYAETGRECGDNEEFCAKADTAEAGDGAEEIKTEENGTEGAEAPESCREEDKEEKDEPEEGGPEKNEEKPEKKERKMKWAKKEKEEKEEKKPDPLAEANEKYLRLFAEFDNFRKRTDKEKTERFDMGVMDMIEKILPVLDNFERGFETVAEEDKEDAFVKGMDLVYKQFVKVLEDAGVQPIEALGKEFNPDLHNAVMHEDNPDVGENTIVEEFQKGYTYKGHVVRYSMVKVAN